MRLFLSAAGRYLKTHRIVSVPHQRRKAHERHYEESTPCKFLASIDSPTIPRQNRLKNRTDRDSLKCILNLPDSFGRFAWWWLCLFEFNIDVAHRRGIKHQANKVRPSLRINGEDTAPLKDGILLLAIETPISTDIIVNFIDTTSDARNLLDAMQIPPNTPNDTATSLATSINADYIRDQAIGIYCRAMASHVGQRNAKVHIVHHGLLVRCSTINGALQAVVPIPLQERTSTLAHYSLEAGHPWLHQIYDRLRRKFF